VLDKILRLVKGEDAGKGGKAGKAGAAAEAEPDK
jgi:hypothetical protein